MNPQHLNYNHNQTSFLQEKQKWEHAISSYKGPDPLDLWHNFICWYENNLHLDHERLFETALGKCLSIFECQQHYNQDTRLVKLWMKYIGLKSNPLNLYQVLYQRGIGTQCSIFYIGWAHYYDAANAFKQAESVYNLGFQANAQPYGDLDQAHKRFRFSLSQRMLYSDQQTKKRTQSQLNDQRQQITTLNSSNSSPNPENDVQPNSYMPTTSPNQQRGSYTPQQEPSSEIQQQQQQQPQQPPPQIQSAQQSFPNSYLEHGASPEHQPSSKRFRPTDGHQSNFNQTYDNSTPSSGAQMGYNNDKSIEYNNHYNAPSVNNGTNNNLAGSPAHAIACSLNSVYSGDEDQASEDYNSYSNYPGANDKASDYSNNDTLTYSQVNNDLSTTSTTSTTILTNESHPSGCILPENHVSYASNKHETWDGALFLDEPEANKICKYQRHLVYPGNGCEYSLEEIRSRNYTKVIEAIKERNRQREIALNEQRHFRCMQRTRQHQQQQQQHQYQQHQYQQQRVEHSHQISFHQQQVEMQNQQKERERLAEIERERLQEMERERERVMKERERQRLAELQRAKEQEEAQRQRIIEQQKIQHMQEQRQQQNAYMQHHSQQYQSAPPNHHQPIHTDQHQPVNNHSYYHPPSTGFNNGTVAQLQINHHPHQQQDYGNYPVQNHQSHYQPQPPTAQPYYNNQRPIQQTPLMQYHSSGIDQNEMYKSQPQSRILYPSHHSQMPAQQTETPHKNSNPPIQSPYQEQHYNNYQPQNPPQQQQYDYHNQSYQAPSSVQSAIPNNNTPAPKMNGGPVTETPPLNNYVDDIEEQIEASTIVLKNGSSKPQKITIKYRKEKSGNGKQVPLTDPLADFEKTPKTKKTKKSKAKRTDLTFANESDSSNLLLNDEIDNQCNESMSNDSYSTPSMASKSLKSKKSKKATKFEPSFLQNDESCSNSDFATLYGKYSNGDTEEKAPNGSRNVRFNFAGATSTPIRNNNTIYQSPSSSAKATHQSNESSSKSSTPRNSYRSLRRRASNGSLLSHAFNENDDSMTSFSLVEPNSFFETENNDELLQQRLDKAMKTIDEHFRKPHIDPFSSELCKSLLVKADFPSREHSEFYILSNALLSKLANTRTVTIGDTRFNVEKEIGRGAYGNVYRGTNANTGDVVALKFQKPPNTWELYICTEVAQRIKDPNLLLGYMDISSAMIAPNASIFVSEFSQFGSLLDINNRIRQNTTKVMHESLVMHFTSQILNIIHHLHSSQIIHGDIKPDNFLLMKIPNANSGVPTLRLIDFGCAIDMQFFKPNTQFKKIVQTDGFTCPEMLEGRLWSYQTDIFCVAATVHTMLFGDYMQMLKNSGGYDIKQKLPRYLKKHIWTEFFSSFLNIKDNHSLPNLLKMKEKIDNELCGMESELQSQIRTLSNILYKR